VFVVWASTGCSAPTPNLCQRLQDEDPSVRVAAVIEAGKTKDPNAIPFLVDRLGDTETEVRFFAALALEKITGQTRGYRYYESSDRREEAIACWRQWLETQAASRPASQPTSQGRQESAP
jgi:HEAT repeat protein